jgi:hypothetical protein
MKKTTTVSPQDTTIRFMKASHTLAITRQFPNNFAHCGMRFGHKRRAHEAELSPRTHGCDRGRFHPCRAARRSRDGSLIHFLRYPYAVRVPLNCACVCDGLVSHPPSCPSGTITIEPSARYYLLESRTAGLRRLPQPCGRLLLVPCAFRCAVRCVWNGTERHHAGRICRLSSGHTYR